MTATTRSARRPVAVLHCATSFFGLAVQVAALDAGLLASEAPGDGAHPPVRRVLVLCGGGTAAAGTGVEQTPGFAALRARFDEVVSWDDVIAPFDPAGWLPRDDDAPLWERHVRRLWGLGDDGVHLVAEAADSPPGLALGAVFPDAPVEMCAPGLSVHGPTATRLDGLSGTRVRRLLHPDLLPGLRPLALGEFGTPVGTVPADALRAVLRRTAAHLRPAGDAPALLLGLPPAVRELLTPAQESQLYMRMVRGAVALGRHRLVLAPHPGAPAPWGRLLEDEAAGLGAELTVEDGRTSPETLIAALDPALVAGCCSDALLTAATLYGCRVARIGADLLLDGPMAYDDPLRVPLALIDALLPDLESPHQVAAWRGMPQPAELAALLGGLRDAVAFCAAPRTYPGLRPAATAYLAAYPGARTARYVLRRRLAALALPGGLPDPLTALARTAPARRVARRARALGRAGDRG